MLRKEEKNNMNKREEFIPDEVEIKIKMDLILIGKDVDMKSEMFGLKEELHRMIPNLEGKIYSVELINQKHFIEFHKKIK